MAEHIKTYNAEDSANDSTISMESIEAVTDKKKLGMDQIPSDGSDVDYSEGVSDGCYTNGVHDMSDLPDSPNRNESCATNGLESDECSLDESGIVENDHSHDGLEEEHSYDNEFDVDENSSDNQSDVGENSSASESDVDGNGSSVETTEDDEDGHDDVESVEEDVIEELEDETEEDVENSPSDIADEVPEGADEHSDGDVDVDVDIDGHSDAEGSYETTEYSEAVYTSLLTAAVETGAIVDTEVAVVEHCDNGTDLNDDTNSESHLIHSIEHQLSDNISDEEHTNNAPRDGVSLNKDSGSDGATDLKAPDESAVVPKSESKQEYGIDSNQDVCCYIVESETLKEQITAVNINPVENCVADVPDENIVIEISTATSLQVDSHPAPDGQPLDLLLIGLTGQGKTSVCKTILGNTDASTQPTTECVLIETVVGGRQLRLLDTPGSIDNKNSEVALKEVANIFALNPNGFHAILFVTKYGSKISDDELRLSEMLKGLLGDDVFSDYVILVVTHADRFKEDAETGNVFDVKDYVARQEGGLKKLLSECKQRVVLFDSAEQDTEKKGKQICHLISMVDEIVDSNGGTRFDNTYFKLARKEMELHASTTITGTETAEEKRALEESITEQVGHAIARQIKKDNSWCFPSNAIAMLSSGELVRMENIRVGDKVLSCANDGKLVFSEVYMLGHAERDAILPCVKISTTKSCIYLSPGHYLFIYNEANKEMTPVTAQNVKCGDRVYICNYSSDSPIKARSMELETVVEVHSTICRGRYAPFTEAGTIVVDGVLASCYVELLPPSLSHQLLWPVRKLYAVWPGLCSILSYSRMDGIPLWIHWCLKTLLPILPHSYYRQ